MSATIHDPGVGRAPDAPALPDRPFAFIRHFVACSRWWYLSMLLLEGAAAACTILTPYALARIIRAVTAAPEHTLALVDSLAGPLVFFFALNLGEVVFSRCAGGLQVWFGPLQRQAVTRAMFAYLQHHSHQYFSNHFAGALAHRVAETAMGTNQTLWAVVFDFWPIAITFAVAIGLLATAHFQLALFVGAWAVSFVALSYWLARRAQPYAQRAAAARSETTGKLFDSVGNLSSAKLFARLRHEREFLDRCFREELVHIRLSNGYAERVRWFQFTAAAVLKVGVLWFGLRLWGQGGIGVAEFVMATSLSLLIISEARNLSRRFLEFFEYAGDVANGVATILRPHDLIDTARARPLTIARGRIEFRRLRFGYDPARPVFDGLDVVIEAGQRVGLVGYSGSGKSSFVSLILRQYDPQEGQVLIDGADLRDFTLDALHAQIGLIPQEPSLFHRSLLDNIRYGRLEASRAEVEEVARLAHAHEFIVALPQGYDALVGERGVKLSGGQRQRIAIARVILKDAPVLILDEATSSLDSVTEQTIQETLDRLMLGKTVIVVAHRLSTIAHLDRILVFDHGRIVEDGSHAELLQRGGLYRRLWSRQSEGFLPQTESEAARAEEPAPEPVRTSSDDDFDAQDGLTRLA